MSEGMSLNLAEPRIRTNLASLENMDRLMSLRAWGGPRPTTRQLCDYAFGGLPGYDFDKMTMGVDFGKPEPSVVTKWERNDEGDWICISETPYRVVA